MTTHSDIIKRAGPVHLARTLGLEPNNIYQWGRSDSIPAPYWKEIVSKGLASIDELLIAAEQKRQSRQTQPTS